MRYDDQTTEDQQEIEQMPVHSEKDNWTPVQNQIVGYNAAQYQSAL